tara:strand:- start:640 stop:1599 length:960 start_codon:yes stop_codon:yes gene_type:complete
MTSLKDKIKILKPNLKDSSVNLYLTNLKKIYRDIECEGRKEICNFDNLDFLGDYDRVMSSLENENANTKKNRLIAIVVSLQASDGDRKLIERYTKEMIDLANQSNENYKKQEKSQKQINNWVEYEDLVNLANNMLGRLKKHSILSKDELTRAEYNLLQEYVVLRFYLNFPLRNDIADVKVINSKDDDDKVNNFLLVDGDVSLLLNDYKTVKTFGPQEYDIDSKFSKIIRIFLKHNRSGFFITKGNRSEAITPNGITKLLNRLFKRELDKTISTSMLRHITASHDRKNDKTLAELELLKKKVEKKYLHSDSTNQLYRKIK